jgi:hypothetical protein
VEKVDGFFEEDAAASSACDLGGSNLNWNNTWLVVLKLIRIVRRKLNLVHGSICSCHPKRHIEM